MVAGEPPGAGPVHWQLCSSHRGGGGRHFWHEPDQHLESSIIGFWGITFLICVGCVAIFMALFNYTRRRRIL